MHTRKKKLLIFNDYFYPGYRGGGPIQSLANLAVAFEKELDIYVVTGITDLFLQEAYEGYKEGTFNTVLLPGSEKGIEVFYAATPELSTKKIHAILDTVAPDVVYLNGIFSSRYVLFPLYVLKVCPAKIVICPRGMLQKGALAIKPFKKKVYITYLWLSRLLKHAHWHATSEEEASDIVKQFSPGNEITTALNIPRTPVTRPVPAFKQPGELKLVYLSLIAKKKNLLQVLQLMLASDKNISLDIYGPVTNKDYWDQCEMLIKKMSEKVSYIGEVQPANVQQVLSKYHALILLTKGENFGHALYESLSAGRPVITSHFTPWNKLYEKKAGINLALENALTCLKTIDLLVKMEQEEYNTFCFGAHKLAMNYYKQVDLQPYRKMFS